jgi:hypothetical protein
MHTQFTVDSTKEAWLTAAENDESSYQQSNTSATNQAFVTEAATALVFLDMVSSFIDTYKHRKGNCFFSWFKNLENRHGMFLHNVGTCLVNHMASQPRQP